MDNREQMKVIIEALVETKRVNNNTITNEDIMEVLNVASEIIFDNSENVVAVEDMEWFDNIREEETEDVTMEILEKVIAQNKEIIAENEALRGSIERIEDQLASLTELVKASIEVNRELKLEVEALTERVIKLEARPVVEYTDDEDEPTELTAWDKWQLEEKQAKEQEEIKAGKKPAKQERKLAEWVGSFGQVLKRL